MSKNLLALDQATKVSGYAVFKDGQLETFGHFSFDSPTLDVRLVQIKTKVIDLIQQYNINEVVFEDVQLQKNIGDNVATFKVLSEVYGVISETLEELQIKHSSMLATSWKSILDIKGKTRAEQKKAAQEYVRRQYNIEATQDESDSICIGVAHLNKSINDWTD